MSLVLVAISALVLFIGWKWGVIAIHGGTVERAKEPGLFWMAMAFAGLLLVLGLAIFIAGK